jgi:hypothetical protein
MGAIPFSLLSVSGSGGTMNEAGSRPRHRPSMSLPMALVRFETINVGMRDDPHLKRYYFITFLFKC